MGSEGAAEFGTGQSAAAEDIFAIGCIGMLGTSSVVYVYSDFFFQPETNPPSYHRTDDLPELIGFLAYSIAESP